MIFKRNYFKSLKNHNNENSTIFKDWNCHSRIKHKDHWVNPSFFHMIPFLKCHSFRKNNCHGFLEKKKCFFLCISLYHIYIYISHFFIIFWYYRKSWREAIGVFSETIKKPETNKTVKLIENREVVERKKKKRTKEWNE